jgi:hypothetical protein
MSDNEPENIDDLCPVCLEKRVLGIELDCGHEFCFLCLKGSFDSGSQKCPLCRDDVTDRKYHDLRIKDIITDEKNILTKITKSDGDKLHTADLKCEYLWVYSGRNYGWWIFQNDIADTVEYLYKKYLDDPSKYNFEDYKIHIGSKQFLFDFEKSEQIREGFPRSLARVIRRIGSTDELPDDINGISGIQK